MSIELIAALMFSSMILLLITGRQIFFIIGGVATMCVLLLWGTGSTDMIWFSGCQLLNWYVLLSIPPFIFMGLMLTRSGVADNLFRALYIWMGHIKGGLAMADVGLSCAVSAMSGTNIASTVTSTCISLPHMLKRNYDKSLVTGVVLAGGSLGVLIPPSVVFIIYGLLARVSAGHLWLAGTVPGLLLAIMILSYIAIRCQREPHLGPPLPVEERVEWRGKFRSLRSGILPIMLIFAVLGLLFMGVTTLNECAAVGAVGSLVCAAVNRKLTFKLFTVVADEALRTTVMIMWIFMAAIFFSSVFDGLGAVHGMEHLLNMVGGGRWGTLIAMQASFVLMGMVLDDTAMLIIVAPLYIPIAAKLGFDLVWYGVLYVLNCQMAYLTPPFGYNLFIMKGLLPLVAPDSGITITDLYRSAIPFVAIQATCLGIVMAFPQIAMWLPNLVFGK